MVQRAPHPRGFDGTMLASLDDLTSVTRAPAGMTTSAWVLPEK